MNSDSAKHPLVSIGVPVFNEEQFIDESLKALLSQDYPNIEIIISDNASTDATPVICKTHMNDASNITFHAFDSNQGSTENFRHVLTFSKGKYFMWASGHDLWAPNFVSKCVHALESNRDAVLAFGSSSWIDENGELMCKTSGWTDTRGMPPLARFFTILWGNMHPILGLMKHSALPSADEIGRFAGSDLVFLEELALKGNFIHATETSWQRREFRHEQNYAEKLKRYRNHDVGLTHGLLSRLFPVLRLPYELTKVLLRSKLPLLPKILAMLALLASFPVRYLSGARNL